VRDGIRSSCGGQAVAATGMEGHANRPQVQSVDGAAQVLQRCGAGVDVRRER